MAETMTPGALGAFAPRPPADPAAVAPDEAARRAYMAAAGGGAPAPDALAAAREAWKGAIAQHAQRLGRPDYQPDPGETNLVRVAGFLRQQKGLDDVTAVALAHELLPALGGPPRQGV